MAYLANRPNQGGVARQSVRKGEKAADRVDDSDRVFRVRKQLNRMLQTASIF